MEKIYIETSEVLHWWKLIKEDAITLTEFADVWNDSIQRSIEAAQQSVQWTCVTCGASLNFVGDGRYQCPNNCLVISTSR